MDDELSGLRSGISHIDSQIITLLCKRFELTDDVGIIKKRKGIPIENKEVEIKKMLELCAQSGGKIRKDTLHGIYAIIFEESKRRQKEL